MEYLLNEFKTDLNIKRIANVHYFEFINSYNTQKGRHDFHELIYVDSGYINVESDSFTGTLVQSQMIIHKPNETHRLYCDGGSGPNVILICFESDSKDLDFFAASPTVLSAANQRYLAEVIKESRSVFLPPYDVPTANMKKRADFPFGADQLIKNLLEYLFIKLIREKKMSLDGDAANDADSQSAALLYEIRNFLETHKKQKLTLAQICLLFATNKTTLCRLFKKHLNCTVVDYINRCRIKEAKILMRKGQMNFTQIADELGLSSVHYFTKLFIKYENMPPSQYVKTVKFKAAIGSDTN